MRKIYLSIMLAGSGIFNSLLFSQNSQVPLSWANNLSPKDVPTVSFQKPDVQALLKDDEEREKNGHFLRFGTLLPADVTQENSGYWQILADGSALWRVRLTSEDAIAVALSYSDFSIPEGASLYIYNEDRSHVTGPYTAEDCPEDGGVFSTSIVQSSSVILEYNQPKSVTGNFNLRVSDFVYCYRKEAVVPFSNLKINESDNCEVNVNCSEGTSWSDEKRGVVRIYVVDGSGAGWCSGSMINNTLQDCTPYVLTANHCGGGATASQLRQWKFYFNYESPDCNNPASEGTLASQVVTGSVKVSSAGTVSDVVKSDFMLLIIKNRPSAAFNAYLNGWNKGTGTSSSGVGIHHPAGDIKKISTYSSSTSSSTWSGSGITNGHWRVTWVSTTNGHGVTEGGSSGSPLFNSAGLIIGDLSGGASYCSSPNSPDLYGKFSYSWSSCGTTSDYQIQPWLDRNSSGVTTLTGKENNCTAGTLPTVDFIASNEYPIINETVTMTDQTTDSPFYWRWAFTPTTYTFVNGTNEYSQNPQVQFTAAGNYLATLYAANTAGYNYKNKTNYIHVGYAGVEDENQPEQVHTYPNPSNGTFIIGFTENIFKGKVTISLTDIQGKMVYLVQQPVTSGNLIQVEVDNSVANGMYILNIYDNENRSTKRIEIIR